MTSASESAEGKRTPTQWTRRWEYPHVEFATKAEKAFQDALAESQNNYYACHDSNSNGWGWG